MKSRIFFTITLIALLLAACGGGGVERGSGNLITESREVSGFDRVELALEGELTLTQGGTESLTIEAEDNVMPKITSEVKNGTLVIGWDTDLSNRVETTKHIKLDLTVKELTGLSLSGSGSINSANLNTGEMDLTLSGAGEIQIANLTAEKLEVDLSGSGSFELAGQVSEQKISVGGSGEYQAAELESQGVKVEISGTGEVAVWANESLDVEISGTGDVNYIGAPTVTEDISGTGSVSPLSQ